MKKFVPDNDEGVVIPLSDCRPASRGFVKLIRGEDVEALIKTSPMAFVLATLIALRARFRPGTDSITGLEQGEAFLGDFENYGMTEQNYRTAKNQLAKWKIATFGPTTRGTVAKLLDSRIFDVVNEHANGQANRLATTESRTTNDKEEGLEGKKGKKETLIRDWCEAFEETFGEKYPVSASDRKAAANAIEQGLLSSEVIDLAKQAWSATNGFYVLRARSLGFLIRNWTSVKSDLGLLKAKPQILEDGEW